MKTYLKIFAILAVLALAVVPMFAMAEDSDAYVEMRTPDIVREFTDNADGSLAIYVLNQTDTANAVTITVSSLDGSHVYKTQDFTVPANTTADNVKDSDRHTVLSFSLGGSGLKQIRITAVSQSDPEDTSSITYNINVSHSIWSDWTTYVVIVIAIIVVVAMVWLRLRSQSDAKKNKPKEKVFTQMEEERKAKKAAKQPEKTSEPAKRETYIASKRKKG